LNGAGISLHDQQLALKPELASIRLAGNWLNRVCADFKVPAKCVVRLDLCLHEALANVLTHGGQAALAQDIVVELRVCMQAAEGEALLRVQDAGAPFDPLSSVAKSSAQSLETVEPGGLGLVMMRSNSDLLEYKREHGLNHLSIGVRWTRSDL
jgi:anti-sigma regulatory factor (Ser/Thr protein kinase)